MFISYPIAVANTRNNLRETGLFLLFQRVLSLAAWPHAAGKNPMVAGLVT